MMASAKPRTSISSASTMYITPMRLWSVDWTYSFQRYGHQPLRQTQTAMAATATNTTSEVISGIGWLKGIASHVSLPNIVRLLPEVLVDCEAAAALDWAEPDQRRSRRKGAEQRRRRQTASRSCWAWTDRHSLSRQAPGPGPSRPGPTWRTG